MLTCIITVGVVQVQLHFRMTGVAAHRAYGRLSLRERRLLLPGIHVVEPCLAVNFFLVAWRRFARRLTDFEDCASCAHSSRVASRRDQGIRRLDGVFGVWPFWTVSRFFAIGTHWGTVPLSNGDQAARSSELKREVIGRDHSAQ